MSSASLSATPETIIYPNQPIFATFDWICTYEIARTFYIIDNCDAIKNKPSIVVNPDWGRLNPGNVLDAVVGSLKLPNTKALKSARIQLNLYLTFEECLGNREKLLEIYERLEYNLILKIPEENGKSLRFEISPPQICKSTALNRSYGADKFLRVRLSDLLAKRLRSQYHPQYRKLVIDFFVKPLRIANRVYHTFLRKDDAVYMVAIPQRSEKPDWSAVAQFTNDVLSVELNPNMSLSKWVSRCSLVVSATNPTITFNPENIRRVPDILSNSLLISHRQMNMIADALGLNYLPSAIRGHLKAKPRQSVVWRLGQIPTAGTLAPKLIQLWEDQVKGSPKIVFFHFTANRYDIHTKQFQVEGEDISISFDHCAVEKGFVGEGEVMTDGAAAISRAAALQIASSNGGIFDLLPSVYQGRIGFAKGLWYLDPMMIDCPDNTPWIEIRDSQWKAECHPGFSFHFNLCRKASLVSSAAIGSQQIPVLTSRGVPLCTLENFLKEYIAEVIGDFSVKDPIRLAHTISKVTSLVSQRRGAILGLSGVLHDPLSFRINKPHSNSVSQSTADGLDSWSLAPSRVEEQLISLLSSGFSKNNRVVVTRVRQVKEMRLKSLLGFRIPIGDSTYVYVMPDPTGTLKENEAFLQFSDFRNSQGMRVSSLVCPALISRSPCVSPIDVRKVDLVANEHLRGIYFNVLVCSIHGKQALLSLLSGGDYDGDTALVIWDPSIVEPFLNADTEQFLEPKTECWFDSVLTESIKDCLLKLYLTNSERFVKESQKILLSGIFASRTYASYAEQHKLCDYVLGTEHHLTVLLGWVYVKNLDAAKQGMCMKEHKDNQLQSLLKIELMRLNLTVEDAKKSLVPKYEEALPRSAQTALNSEFIFYRRNNNVHVLDALQKIVLDELRALKEAFKEGDDLNHHTRARERDEDLSDFFMSQLVVFDKPFKDFKMPQIDQWSFEGVRYGVLRRMKSFVQDCKETHAASMKAREQEIQNDLVLQEIGDYTPSNGQIHGDNFRYRKIMMDFHEKLTWEAAHHLDSIDEERLKNASTSEQEKYHDGKRAYLEGLGSDGYNLLKASCAAAVAAPEGFFPYNVAFREICYLKAVATSRRDPRYCRSLGNTPLNLNQYHQHPRVPFTLESVTHLASIFRPSVVTRTET